MHVLLATDADWVIDEVTAALGGPDTSFTVCREGRLVSDLVEHGNVDVVITDLQIGSMGGMAVAMALRLDASVGSVPLVPIVMLLDRAADVYLAQRSGAESWLIKPLDALRLRRAVNAAVAGESYTEGMPVELVSEVEAESADGDTAGVVESTEPETVDAG
ncbi:MAG: response regulator [Ilumatobacteraceae bacterium]